ncbi:MAG: hypothetical protein KAR83_08335 [Thermodesulfovibrionales bacterium]|nr:hypothetical protein [Thermodesulfovibrionales bacterium]
MLGVIIFIGCVIFDYVAIAMIVGVAFFFLFGHRNFISSTKKTLVILIIIFGFIDYYYLPVLALLDITFTIGNQQIAEFFGSRPDMSLDDIFNPGFLDIFIWLIQAIIAHFTGTLVYQRIMNRSTSPAKET